MNTMQWQASGFSLEIDQDDFEHRHTPETKSTMSTEREESEAIQKHKYEDQSANENRKAHIALIEKFGTLLLENKLEEIARDLLADDVQVFIFGSTAANSAQYTNRADEFVNLYKDVHIQERIARETDFDEEKETVGQVCTYKTVFKDESSVIDEVSCELFTIKDGRITKYRVSFGRPRFKIGQFKDPLEHTRKEKMLARVKEINYALARQPPDFEKVASLLDENVEYKLCGWDAFKSGVLFKENLAESFQNLSEGTNLLSVIPYELYTNEHGNFVTGTYVYNLQNKISGKKLVWLSTCVYGFNQNLNINKVIHQGEMYDEDDVEIPFEVFTRSKIEERLNEYYNAEANLDIFYSDKILYDCTLWSLCNEVPDMGYFQGVKDIEELMKTMDLCQELNPSFIKIIDVYVDYHNKSHDVAYALLCMEGPSVTDGKPNPEIVTNCIGFMRIAYENGKMAKIFEIISEIKEPVPTPFDDKTFNFICRK